MIDHIRPGYSVQSMRRRKVLSPMLAVLLAAIVVAAPALAASGPSQSQIRAAVARARASKNLWATVNVCGPRSARRTIGIRAQMPGLGFSAQLSVRIQLEYWNVAKQHFVVVADPNAHGVVRLGTVVAGLQQGGESFAFTHGAYLRATVTFTYRRHGKQLLSVTRHTTGGHPLADQGRPAHYTAAACRLH